MTTEDIERRNARRDDILCSLNHARSGMVKARARGDLGSFHYFLEKAGEHRLELAAWAAECGSADATPADHEAAALAFNAVATLLKGRAP